MAAGASRNKKAKNRKGLIPAIIAGGASVLLYSIIFPLHSLQHFILAGVVAFIVGGVVKIMASGMDVSAKNTPAPEPEPEPEPMPNTGDSAADALILRGREMIRAIEEENAAIPDAKLTQQMDELASLCSKIFHTVAEKPGIAPQIRRFMDYYLPTTLKMLQSYHRFAERGISGQEARDACARIEDAMAVVVSATRKQLNTLYKDEALDISTDIDVLEAMLRQDGLSSDNLTMEGARRAQASQMASSGSAQSGSAAGAAARAPKP